MEFNIHYSRAIVDQYQYQYVNTESAATYSVRSDDFGKLLSWPCSSVASHCSLSKAY